MKQLPRARGNNHYRIYREIHNRTTIIPNSVRSEYPGASGIEHITRVIKWEVRETNTIRK